MHRDITLTASVMCLDWMNAGKQLTELQEAGIDSLHIDIIDGSFAPDFTFGSSILDPLRKHSPLPADFHLMVEEPSRCFEALHAKEGEYFVIHQECCRNLHRDLVTLKRLGLKPGVALCPGTPLNYLEYVIEEVEMVMLMTVNPGYMGQPLVPQTLRKITDLRKQAERMGLDIKITADGNVNAQHIPDMVAAGANWLVLGSSGLFKTGHSLAESLERVKDRIDFGLGR